MSSPSSAAPNRGFLLVVLAALCWGTAGITGRLVSERTDLGPLDVAWYRMAVGAVALVAVHLVGRRRASPSPAPTRPVVLRLLLVGAGLGGYQLAYFSAVARAGVSISTLVALGLAPLFVAVAGAVLGHGRPERTTLLALVVALVGLVLLVGVSAGAGTGTTVLVGALLAVGSALGYAMVTVVGGGIPAGVPVTPVAFAVGAALLTPVALAGGLHVPSRRHVDRAAALPGAGAQRGGLPAVLHRDPQRARAGRVHRDAARTADRDRAGDRPARRAAGPGRAGRGAARARRRRRAVPAEDGRFELPRGCPQPAFQASAIGH